MPSLSPGATAGNDEITGTAHANATALLALLDLPSAAGVCPIGPPLYLEDRSESKKQQVVRVSCRCWNCDVCAARLRLQAGVHFGGKLVDGVGPVFASPSPAESWKPDQLRLHRADASWVRVAGAGTAILLGTAALAGGAASPPAAAVILLGDALRGILPARNKGKRCRPVTSSRDWAPNTEEQSAMRLIGQVRVYDPDSVVAVLAEFGVGGHKKRLDGVQARWRVNWTLPTGLSGCDSAILSWKIENALKELVCINQ